MSSNMLKLKSADSSSQIFSYDVFLSFRGEDIRKTFTDHLYKALLDEGFTTFCDDNEIERGEISIKSEMVNDIQHSRSWIIIFSENYASSSWCLDELVLILEYSNNSKRLILPIFYDVDPSDIYKQSGCISEALHKHEEQFKREVDDTLRKDLMAKLKSWRIALAQVAYLGGITSQNIAKEHESKFIEEIVKVIMDKVTCTMSSINEKSNIDSSSPTGDDILLCSRPLMERKPMPQHEQALKCPRCDSTQIKFCYYNNYSLSQPRYFCKTCKRYWTKGATLKKNILIGNASELNKKV